MNNCLFNNIMREQEKEINIMSRGREREREGEEHTSVRNKGRKQTCYFTNLVSHTAHIMHATTRLCSPRRQGECCHGISQSYQTNKSQ